ncbi:MAG: NAD+ synthase [Gammaproteobacteria bacterium]|nr:MAG: NAD+ synthase [Gammaproteobacteria bacterium]
MAQLNFLVGDIPGNRDRIINSIHTAKTQHNADCIIFSELAVTGYPPEDLLLRPGFLKACSEANSQIADQCHDITAILGSLIQQEDKLFNAALIMRNGTIEKTYRKQCLPNYSVFDEERYFVAGTAPVVFELEDGIKAGLSVCEDIWCPEPALELVKVGANLVINLNASPFHLGKKEQRLETLGSRVKETGLPIVYVNQTGGQDELVFDGGSMVVDQSGKVMVLAPEFEEGLFAVDMQIHHDSLSVEAGDISQIENEEALLYKALVCGVRDYVNKNGFSGAVLGLSGGIDSALTLAIAVDALGADRVTAVMMPSRYTADISLEDAREEASTLGIKYHVIPIKPAFDAFTKMLSDVFAKTERDVTEENLQARIRGVVLMAMSNKLGQIVLTTGNKSEMAVGYATLYGDMAGGFAPLKDVYKTMVYRLAKYRNTLSYVIPDRVIKRPPTAELAPDQVDQDSLPPYDRLDGILKAYIEKDLSREEITRNGFLEEVVSDVTRKVDLNEYKRRQAPPGIKVTERAFGRDRRYPITSGYREHES